MAKNLFQVPEGRQQLIVKIALQDGELESFLFSLGCYAGEPITVITHQKSGCTVSIKDGRYHIDRALAQAILVEEIV